MLCSGKMTDREKDLLVENEQLKKEIEKLKEEIDILCITSVTNNE